MQNCIFRFEEALDWTVCILMYIYIFIFFSIILNLTRGVFMTSILQDPFSIIDDLEETEQYFPNRGLYSSSISL